jgi:hypothetical protein
MISVRLWISLIKFWTAKVMFINPNMFIMAPESISKITTEIPPISLSLRVSLHHLLSNGKVRLLLLRQIQAQQ